MKSIKPKSLTIRILTLALGCAALLSIGCGGDDSTPPPDNTCGGITGKACTAGNFCEFAGGTCGAGDSMGTCQPIPTTECPQECVPVCGCDAKSYCNACIAHAAGIDVSADMICDGTPPSSTPPSSTPPSSTPPN